MTISTNAAGVACCGSCGSELEVRCTGDCAEPDIVFRENFVATMVLPGGPPGKCGPQKKTPIRRPGFCAWPAGCALPVAKREPGAGRPPIMCEGHIKRRPRAKKAASNGETA